MAATEGEKTSLPIPHSVDTSEWYETVQPGVFCSDMTLPPADDQYVYAGCRLLSWFPIGINTRGAAYDRELLPSDLIQTFVGTLANLRHDKSKVVGVIWAIAATDDGIDAIVRIDREAAIGQGMDLEQLRSGNYFSHVSIECTRDPTRSLFYVYDDQFNVKRKIPVMAGEAAGIRRTTAKDPYLFQGMRVAEIVVPEQFTGVAFVPNPSDRTAELYALAADDSTKERKVSTKADEPYGADADYADPGFQSDGKKRYPLDTPEHAKAAASYFGKASNRNRYSPDQRAHIDAKIAAAEKRHGIGEPENGKEKASMTEDEIKALQADAEKHKAEAKALRESLALKETASVEDKATITALESKLAEAASKLDVLNKEKASADEEIKKHRIDALLGELVAIKAPADDAEKASLREKASAAVGDEKEARFLKLERENLALKEIAAKKVDPEKKEDDAIEKLTEAQKEEKAKKEKADAEEKAKKAKEEEDKKAKEEADKKKKEIASQEDDALFKIDGFVRGRLPVVPTYDEKPGSSLIISDDWC